MLKYLGAFAGKVWRNKKATAESSGHTLKAAMFYSSLVITTGGNLP